MSYTFTAASTVPDGSFVTFVSGLDIVSVPVASKSGSTIAAVIPAVSAGQTYIFVTNSNITTTLNDSCILFGPAILEGKHEPAPRNVDLP